MKRFLILVLSMFAGGAFAAQHPVDNAPGSPDTIRAAFTSVNTDIATVFVPIAVTANETAAAVTIVAEGYPPGDLRRYGVACAALGEGASVTTPTSGNTNAAANTTILNALGAAGWTAPITFFWPAGHCGINDAVVFSNANISHYFENRSVIDYFGSASGKIAFTQGNSSNSQGSKEPFGGAGIAITNRTSNTTYADDDFVGLQTLGTVQNSTIRIRRLDTFTSCWRIRPSTSGFTYNTINLGQFSDCKYGIDIHSYDASAFVNENLFLGGSFRSTGMGNTINSYAIRFKAESGAYTDLGRNVFQKPSFEMGNAAGATDRSAVLYDAAGVDNYIRDARMETGRTQVVKVVATSTYSPTRNRFTGSVLSGTFTSYLGQTDAQRAFGNTVEDNYVRGDLAPIYRSGDLVKLAFGTDTAKISIKGMFLQSSASSTEAYTGTARILRNYIYIPDSSNAIGVYVDTSAYKSFIIHKDTASGFEGRTAVVCYDPTNTILDNGGGSHPYAVLFGGSGGSSLGAATYGYRYVTTIVNDVEPVYVTVGTACDHMKLLFFGSASVGPLQIRSFTINALTAASVPKPLRVYTNLAQSADEWYVNGNPATVLGGAFVAKGQRVSNSAVAAGSPDGYVASAEGWNAYAWVAGATYVAGELVNNDTGKTYECLTGGIAAGSGGPTGTATSGITDNTAVWGYIGTQATWLPTTTNAANPSASIALAAVNGSATTFMRSDAAPALDVSIAPTWTGIHNYSAAEPRVKLTETDGSSDEKLWDWDLNSKTLLLRTRTDADGAGVNLLSFLRGTGTALSNISIGNATNNASTTFLGTGVASFNGGLSATAGVISNVNATNPIYRIVESDQGTDLKRWELSTNGGVTSLATTTDANAAGKTGWSVTRGATTVVSTVTLGNSTDNPSIVVNGPLTLAGSGATTGAQTATFSATNKPGAGTGAPTIWIPVIIGGTTYWVPGFAN